ncbi:MAG: HAMP domain-containing histidine kinase [Armatimonadetes bacterium]|nr:HAMP domain-containing histidine kinase [Armatimonadota bacterium]
MHNYPYYVTATLYWLLILVWSAILIFYRREYKRFKVVNPLVASLLVVIFVDGARTLFESLYFGVWYTARTGLLPYSLYDILSEPQWLIIPKGFNLIAALLIVLVILRGWFSSLEKEAERQQETEKLLAEVQESHEELQNLVRLRDDLTHMIVHDLRTPLTSIIGNLHTVQQTDYDPELMPEMVGNSLRAGETLLSMVNDLLDISRLEAGGSLKMGPFQVKALVEEAVSLINPLLMEKEQALTVSFSEAMPEGWGDKDILRRVLVNLLGNAVKFTPQEGKIALAACMEGDFLCISVSDTGKGIPPDIKDRIFDKFFHRAGHTTYQPSTGLGLAFCKLAVEGHGGHIRVESEPYQGSTFRVIVPLQASVPVGA